MKKKLWIISILSIIVGTLIAVGLGIWLGFPSPNYNRYAICFIGFAISLALIFLGAGIIATSQFD